MAMIAGEGQHKNILGMRVDVTNIDNALNIIQAWSSDSGGHYICVSNVHMCMECYDDQELQSVVNAADLVVPDGRPLVWAQKLLGEKSASQVRGMDLVLKTCERMSKKGIKVGFYGGTPKILDELKNALQQRYIKLDIACLIAPPFRPLTEEEDKAYVSEIRDSGAQILFVGIGCPKQEYWMAEHKGRLSCVMLGVGAAFDFIAGQKRHAPRWMQFVGLEWLFRLLSEPRRLWKRYLKHNPRFVWYFSRQLIRVRVRNIRSGNRK